MVSLNDIFSESGEEALIGLLSSELSITEKINGHRLIVKKKANGKVDFYTKKLKHPIGVLDNLMTDMYADAIDYILKNKDRLPYGETSFYLVKNDLGVKYTDVPDQTLIITNTNNKIDISTKEIASIAGFRHQEDIFSGTLSKEQIKHIVSYFGGDRELPLLFSDIFDTNVNSLNANKEDIIEGYIFNIGGKLYKLEDRRYEKKDFKKINTSNYELLVSSIVDHFDVGYIDALNLYQTKHDFRYIEIISCMFNEFVSTIAESEIDFLAILPTFSENTGNVNTKYIMNKNTVDYVKSSPKYEYLFRVFLQLFKRNLECRGIIDENVCKKQSMLALKIEDRASRIGMPTFEEAINLKIKK